MRGRGEAQRGGRVYHSGPAAAPAEELAARLAPPEERANGAADGGKRGAGAIVVDAASLKTPDAGGRERESRFGVSRVVLFVAGLMLIFTAFIAWQIYLTPDDRDEP